MIRRRRRYIKWRPSKSAFISISTSGNINSCSAYISLKLPSKTSHSRVPYSVLRHHPSLLTYGRSPSEFGEVIYLSHELAHRIPIANRCEFITMSLSLWVINLFAYVMTVHAPGVCTYPANKLRNPHPHSVSKNYIDEDKIQVNCRTAKNRINCAILIANRKFILF